MTDVLQVEASSQAIDQSRADLPKTPELMMKPPIATESALL
eukprot:CAMPEP_0172680630 /NCGR_PEP_ID=MMETSP1074-20121228/16895_1 /TAXON_ID=2916 /ORGANISM="Ceratium fusus, Strain PA161109" /LENGTH=40 /DNA_ID= /DNA_START= /DNA_END= /DNA_ORIENTATION=